MVEHRRMHFVPDMKQKVLEAIEEGAKPGSCAWAYSRERPDSLFGEDLVNANGKHIACLAPLDVGALPANCRRVDRSRVLHL